MSTTSSAGRTKKALVVGGAGYLGSALVWKLLASRGWRVSVIDRLDHGDGPLYPLMAPGRHEHDLARLESFSRHNFGPDAEEDARQLRPFMDHDVCFHLAGTVGEADCSYRPQRAHMDNIIVTDILADAFRDRLVFASTCSVYGWKVHAEPPCAEDAPPNPVSLYGEHKVEGEKIVLGKGGACLRFGTLLGPSYRMRWELLPNAMILQTIATHSPFIIFDPLAYRPYLTVDQAVSALLLLGSLAPFGESRPGGALRLWNLASVNWTKEDLAINIRSEVANLFSWVISDDRKETRSYRASSAKWLNEFGDSYPCRLDAGAVLRTLLDVRKMARAHWIRSWWSPENRSSERSL